MKARGTSSSTTFQHKKQCRSRLRTMRLNEIHNSPQSRPATTHIQANKQPEHKASGTVTAVAPPWLMVCTKTPLDTAGASHRAPDCVLLLMFRHHRHGCKGVAVTMLTHIRVLLLCASCTTQWETQPGLQQAPGQPGSPVAGLLRVPHNLMGLPMGSCIHRETYGRKTPCVIDWLMNGYWTNWQTGGQATSLLGYMHTRTHTHAHT